MICFVVGFAYTAFSFLSGTLHVPFACAASFSWSGTEQGITAAARIGSSFGIFNPMTISVFLAWFGGTGYLLVHLRHIWVFAGLVFSTLSGLVGAGVVFVFAAKYFMAHESSLDPMDFEMVGVLGQVSGSIRSRGTGEIIFVQEGARKACAARSEEGEEIRRGEEVVVTRFDQGVAYVRRWSELAEKAGVMPEEEEKSL